MLAEDLPMVPASSLSGEKAGFGGLGSSGYSSQPRAAATGHGAGHKWVQLQQSHRATGLDSSGCSCGSKLLPCGCGLRQSHRAMGLGKRVLQPSLPFPCCTRVQVARACRRNLAAAKVPMQRRPTFWARSPQSMSSTMSTCSPSWTLSSSWLSTPEQCVTGPCPYSHGHMLCT